MSLNTYPTTSCSMCLTSNPSYSAKQGLKAPGIQRRCQILQVDSRSTGTCTAVLLHNSYNWLKAFPQWSSICPHLDKQDWSWIWFITGKEVLKLTAMGPQPWLVRFLKLYFHLFRSSLSKESAHFPFFSKKLLMSTVIWNSVWVIFATIFLYLCK